MGLTGYMGLTVLELDKTHSIKSCILINKPASFRFITYAELEISLLSFRILTENDAAHYD